MKLFIALAAPPRARGLSHSYLSTLVESNPRFIYLLFGRRAMLSSCLLWMKILSPQLFVRCVDVAIQYLFQVPPTTTTTNTEGMEVGGAAGHSPPAGRADRQVVAIQSSLAGAGEAKAVSVGERRHCCLSVCAGRSACLPVVCLGGELGAEGAAVPAHLLLLQRQDRRALVRRRRASMMNGLSLQAATTGRAHAWICLPICLVSALCLLWLCCCCCCCRRAVCWG